MNLLTRLTWALRGKLELLQLKRGWRRLRERGMHLGSDVWLPRSTWIDPDYCFLISIGDHCGFGEECLILAHDAQMDEFLDATRVGRVVIHDSTHVGARTTILPGVEIGPRTIVGANSVVTKSLPPETVCAGNPARVLCSLGDYLARHQSKMERSAALPYRELLASASTAERLKTLTRVGDAYVTGGRSAELRGEGGSPRTPPCDANA
jgi:maltose O-acetyltransferase